MNERELILMELLAAQSHASWSHWMAYLFSVCEKQPDGSVLIPARLVQRWERQRQTEYALLTEKEKQSDRDQAALAMPIIRCNVNGYAEQDQAARGEQQVYEWTDEEVASHDAWYATRNQNQAAS